MMKNNYLLPSNLDIIKNIKMKKVFNVWIKEGNKWKVTSTILEGFWTHHNVFGLMNPPAIFQAKVIKRSNRY